MLLQYAHSMPIHLLLVDALRGMTVLPTGHTVSVFGRFVILAYTADPSADHALPSVWSYCARSDFRDDASF